MTSGGFTSSPLRNCVGQLPHCGPADAVISIGRATACYPASCSMREAASEALAPSGVNLWCKAEQMNADLLSDVQVMHCVHTQASALQSNV